MQDTNLKNVIKKPKFNIGDTVYTADGTEGFIDLIRYNRYTNRYYYGFEYINGEFEEDELLTINEYIEHIRMKFKV